MTLERHRETTEVGHVAALFRYPAKSTRGEVMNEARLDWTGIAGDRQFAFFQVANTSHFPWLTGSDLPELVLYEARHVAPGDPAQSPVCVATPDGREHDIWDPALHQSLSAAAGKEVRPIRIKRGTFNSLPLSVLSTRTGGRLAAAWGTPVDLRRFRPNIIVDLLPDLAMDERDWIGHRLMVGDDRVGPIIRVSRQIRRCVMITIDPDHAEKDPRLMRLVAQEFSNEIGVHCTIDRPGSIAVGDRIRVA